MLKMRRLVDLNRGAIFKDTTGLVGSAPFKLGDQIRQGPSDPEMNVRAIYHHTRGVGPSRPLHMGQPTFGQERERLKTSYSIVHGHKNTKKGSCWGDKKVKPSSKRLLCGTNEEAEDLTGQRAPISSSRYVVSLLTMYGKLLILRWCSEIQDKYKGNLGRRPSSAPHFNPRQISLMDNQEPVFHHTKQYSSRTHQMQACSHTCITLLSSIIFYHQELYPFKVGVVSKLRDLDTFQTTYSYNHKPFNRNEQICGPYWTR